MLRRVLNGETAKVKQVRQALQDLAEEGLVQVFRPVMGGNWIVGVVGVLQLDVLKSRVGGEYGEHCCCEGDAGHDGTFRWVSGGLEMGGLNQVDANRGRFRT